MDKFESERKPRLLNAKSLVNFIAHAGPGSSLQVRIRFKNRIIALGKTAWSDDRVGGPSVTFPNPKNKKESFIIPLGGQVMYDRPPKISTLTNARATQTPFGEVRAHQRPIDPIAQGYSFELVSE